MMNNQSSGVEIKSGNISVDVPHSSQTHESETGTNDTLGSLIGNDIDKVNFEVGTPMTWMPTFESMMQVQLEEVQQRERELKQQWGRNGCSLIFDRWSGQCGKIFISVLVHCSEGMLFLRSMDVSTIIDDIDELASMVSGVVDEIGVNHIVHIITNDRSPYMHSAERDVLKIHDSFSLTLCADYCINLLLGNIASLDHVSGVLLKARQITRFIYSHALPVELKDYIPGGEIISNCNLKYVAVFLTLERLVSQRANLFKMFNSPAWTYSPLASTNLSMQISETIQSDESFWCGAAKVLKVTCPLVSVLFKLEDSDNCSMGVLYDAMDNAKDEIKQSLRLEHRSYWKMIDRIWDNYLHSAIHAAGYFLNPKIFYSDRLHHDNEVSSGIRSCMFRYARSLPDAIILGRELELYEKGLNVFGSEEAAREAMGMPQVAWWSRHGVKTHKLQAFAKRVLSQTCFGASRYNLDYSLSERVHAEETSSSSGNQELLRKQEYIHYNLRLMNSKPLLGGPPTSKLRSHKLRDWFSAEHNTPVA